MKRIFILVLFVIFCQVSFGQVYQLMPQYGYQALRMNFDSTLQIPTVCGVPTLKSVYNTRRGAIAFDSCNNRFYTYNPKTFTWSYLGGGGGSQNLQQVTDIGATTTNTIQIDKDLSSLKLFDYRGGNQYDLLNYQLLDGTLGTFYVRVNQDNFAAPHIYSYGQDGEYTITANENGYPKLNFNTSGNFLAMSGGGKSFYVVPDSTIYDNTFIGGTSTTLKYNYQNVDAESKKYFFPTHNFGNNSDDTINITTNVNGVFADENGTITINTGSQNGRFGNDTATVVMAKIHNNSGTTLTNGKVVFLASSGTNSDAPSVRLANNKHDSTSANTFGFVTGNIASNDTGYIVLSGKIEKLNTSAFSNGDIIYLDSVSGNWTKTKPQAPYHMVYLGVVVKANAGNGSIFVKCQNGYELSEIHDCQINNPLNNQIIAYSDTQKVWKNRNIYSVVDTINTIATKTNVSAKVNISDTASMLSNYAKTSAVNLKVNISDTATMLSKYLRKTDTSTLSTRIDSKLAISDTSALQRKSVAAFTFKANNTASTANATDQVFRDSGTLTYSGTITWTGTTAPSGATSHRYRWCQIGKQVTLTMTINYATAGTALSAVKLTLPVGCPTPTNFGTLTAANDVIGSAWAFLGITTSNATTARVTLNNNASNNGYEFNITAASANYKVAGFTITYFTD